MATIRYDIVMSPDGWRVHCKGLEGPPFSSSDEAIRDALFAAGELAKTGETVRSACWSSMVPPKCGGTSSFAMLHDSGHAKIAPRIAFTIVGLRATAA